MPCGQIGRLVQTWTSRTSPIAPARMTSTPRAEAVAGRALVAHLRGDLVLGGHLAHLPGFPDAVRQRLLAVDMLAQLHRRDRWRRHGDGRAC